MPDSRYPHDSRRPQSARPGNAPRPRTDPSSQQPVRRSLSPRERAIRESRRKRRQREQTVVLALLAGIFVMIIVLIAVILSGKDGGQGEVTDSGTGTGDAITSGEGQTGDAVSGDWTTEAPQTPPQTTEPADTDNVPVISVPDVTFTADLSAYEAYMNPQGDQRDAYLVLVNPDNPLSEADTPTDLMDLINTRKDGRNTQQMRKHAAMALEAMFKEADALGHLNDSTGYMLSVTSAYRSYSYQDYLFNSYVDQEMDNDSSLTRAQAEAIVEKYSCRAGTSEHQSGLCADLHNQLYANEDAPEVFANTPEGKWITENCWKFGFVLRFPADKTEITGISYESWHFRYVGRYHAYRMNELGMCLEEYVAHLSEME